MAKTYTKDISYLNKDFNQFRENLINFSKTYFKDIYNDFNETNPGMMFIELASYVGDSLSFYIDTQFKENLLFSATETANVLSMAQALGYKPKPAFSAKTKIDVFQLIPATGTGAGIHPDWNYALSIKTGMQVTSTVGGATFRTLDNIDFAVSNSYDPTEINIYSADNSGNPTYYLLKKQVNVEAGIMKTTEFSVGTAQRYYTAKITDTNVIAIESVYDSEGNRWYEVPFLAQDKFFIDVLNNEYNSPEFSDYNDSVPYLLKQYQTSKRFKTYLNSDYTTELQFGAGNSAIADEIIIPNPDNVGLSVITGTNNIDETWDTANFLYTRAYGQTPANTTLTVKYFVGGGIESNAPSNTITSVTSVVFNEKTGLDATLYNRVKGSLAVNNPIAATGGRSAETPEEIRDNALSFFAAQDRAVTKEDYIMRCYTLNPKYGAIAKAYITQDDQMSIFNINQKIANPCALNLYILSFDNNNNLTQANYAIKQNLKTYLNKYKMLTDAINIRDAFVVNIGVKFEVTILPDYIAEEVLLKCIAEIKSIFDINKMQINQPIIKADIIRDLANVEGVQSIIGLSIYNLFDTTLGYSPNYYNIDGATYKGIIYPSLDPMIFEIKNPNTDIVGKVVAY